MTPCDKYMKIETHTARGRLAERLVLVHELQNQTIQLLGKPSEQRQKTA
jgi:hypothetical protein